MNTGELRAFFAANGESRRIALEEAEARINRRIAECADPYDEPEEQYLAGLRDALKLLRGTD